MQQMSYTTAAARDSDTEAAVRQVSGRIQRIFTRHYRASDEADSMRVLRHRIELLRYKKPTTQTS